MINWTCGKSNVLKTKFALINLINLNIARKEKKLFIAYGAFERSINVIMCVGDWLSLKIGRGFLKLRYWKRRDVFEFIYAIDDHNYPRKFRKFVAEKMGKLKFIFLKYKNSIIKKYRNCSDYNYFFYIADIYRNL